MTSSKNKSFLEYLPKEDLKDPIVKQKIESLLKFFNETGIDYDKFDPNFLKGTSLSEIEKSRKKAYPNNDVSINIPGEYDTKKWLETIKEIYFNEKNGLDRVSSIKKATHGWKIMEVYHFLNWLKYYEEGAHLKYKFAQLWYENGAPGYFLQVKPDPQKEESHVTGNDIDQVRDHIAEEIPLAEKKRIIEKQRNKIVGRLDSAEKLLRTHEGQIFADKELESLLETIYQLKKKLHMVNKKSTSTRLYEDMIIREANILNKSGFKKASQLLISVAQANNPPPPNTGTTKDTPISPEPPAAPAVSSGAPGGLPSVGPGMPQNPPESAPQEFSAGVAEFLKNMETGNIGVADSNSNEDSLEVEDSLSVVAQDITPQTKEPKLEVEEKDLGEPSSKEDRDFDHIIDSAFANVSINDIVSKLENVSKIYKTRELPRQLAFIDMMLDSKGLAAYFPSLSEAINKALESNNYISTRLDEMLARLQGGIEGKSIDLIGNVPPSPEVAAIKKNLQEEEDKEKLRKKLRKEQENRELTQNVSKETPKINLQEDLTQPPTQTAPPI